MAAYAALVSVMQILDQLEHHPSPPISITKKQVESLTGIVTSLQEFLEGYDSPAAYSDEADPLEMRIADAAYAVEDVIESCIVDTIELRRLNSAHDQEISSSRRRFLNRFRGHNKGISFGEESRRWNNFYQDVQKAIEEMDSIKKVVMEKMGEKSCTSAVQAHQQQRNKSFSEKNTSITVGFDGMLLQLLEKLIGEPLHRQVIPITGMGGIGKTTLARNIFEDARVKDYFDKRAWVTISQQYETKEIISKIHDQVTGVKSEKSEKSEEELGVELYQYLSGRRYLIILDDIWSIDVWEKIQYIFGDSNNGSRIIVTTRQSYLTSQMTESFCLDMKLLNEDNSWSLFSKTVFGEEKFPLELEEIGKKIVKISRGLPLSIVVIGGLLAKFEHTKKYWELIEQNLNSMVNSENGEYCLRILKMSYNHLPAYLKPCFLYMGIFEEDTKIVVSTLIKLWVSEGLLKPENGKSLETIGKGFLNDLIDRNLVLIDGVGSIGDIRFCKMHDLLRDLCLKESESERFYHVIRKHRKRGNYDQRRVFSNKPLKSMSHVRSVTSQYHRDGVVLPKLSLLRILNAKYWYLKKDPFHELVNCRYLAVTATGWNINISSSVNFLWNLQTLRVACHGMKTRFVAPDEIWKMSQLRHIEFAWGNIYLPDPPSGHILENLQTLRGVRNFKFVDGRTPNIKRLKIEYVKDGDQHSLSNLECLRKLESFTSIIYWGSDVLLYNITFPQTLKKLSLDLKISFAGWEEMLQKIGSLPLLQKLKLSGGSFRTREWETVDGQFPSLKNMSLTDCGLDHWMTEDSSHFPCLERLTLVDMNELAEIPSEIGEIPTLKSIRLFTCSNSAVWSAKNIVKEQEELQGEKLPFNVTVLFTQEQRESMQGLDNQNFWAG